MNVRVLLITDDAMSLQPLRERLEELGYEIRCVDTISEAVLLLDQFSPQIILYDWPRYETRSEVEWDLEYEQSRELDRFRLANRVPICYLVGLSHVQKWKQVGLVHFYIRLGDWHMRYDTESIVHWAKENT